MVGQRPARVFSVAISRTPPTLAGAYSALLGWSRPARPNGLISQYRLVHRKHQQDPTLNATAVTALTVEVSSHTEWEHAGREERKCLGFFFAHWHGSVDHLTLCCKRQLKAQTGEVRDHLKLSYTSKCDFWFSLESGSTKR